MLISGKGKYISMRGCISKNFPENIFWCLEKKKENTNPKTQATPTTNSVRRPRRRLRSKIAIDGAISQRRDRDRRIFLSYLAIFLDGSSSRISRPTYDMSRSRIFLSRRRSRSRSGAISPSRDRDQRCDLAMARSRSSLLLLRARALSLSLIFRKCFEGKIEV